MAKFSSVKIFSGFLVSSIDALDTVRKSIQPVKIQQCSAGVVICLERGADCLQSEAQLTPLHPKTPSSLASVKSRLVLPSWTRLSQAVLERSR